MPRRENRFPANYERNNYILSCSVTRGAGGKEYRQQNSYFPSHNLVSRAPNSSVLPSQSWLMGGIKQGNSTKTVPCAPPPTLIIQWLMRWGSGTLTCFWLVGGGLLWPLSAFFGWKPALAHMHRGVAAHSVDPKGLWLAYCLQPLIQIHTHTHRHLAPAGWIGLPHGSEGCLCFASCPLFSSWEAAECSKSLTLAVRLYRQL